MIKSLIYSFLICLLAGQTQAAILQLTSPQAPNGTLSASAGDTLTLAISIDTEGAQIRGLDTFIDLPDSLFEVIDASPLQPGVQPFQSRGFISGSIIYNRLSTNGGSTPDHSKLDYSEIRQAEAGSSSGTGIVATCQLVALRSAENFSARIVRQFPLRQTKYFVPGQDTPVFFLKLHPLSGTVVGLPVANLPAIRVPVGLEDSSLDLDDYVEHSGFADADFTWTAHDFDASLISVDINAFSHTVTFRSISAQVGQTTVVFTATNPDGETGSARLTLTVTSGPKLLLTNEFSFIRDTSLQIDLDQYVEDADNAPSELIWDISGGNHISIERTGQRLTLTASAGWVGVEVFTFTVRDSDGIQDQKSVAISVTASAPTPGNGGSGGTGENGGNGGTNTPPDRNVLPGMVGIWERASGDTLFYADVGDTLNLDIQANLGTEKANGFELFVSIDSRYLTPVDQGPAAGIQPFFPNAVLPQSWVWFNGIVNLPDETQSLLRYTEVSLAGTVTDTVTVANLQLRIVQSIPADSTAIITIENDTLNKRKTSFTVGGTTGQNFALIPRNRVQVQNRPPILHLPTTLSVIENEELVLGLDDLVEDRMFTPAEMTWEINALEEGFSIELKRIANKQQVVLRPPPDQHGTFTLIFLVADPEGLRAWEASELTVDSVNDKPTLSKTFREGIAFDEDGNFAASIDTLASDPDNDSRSLNWTVENGQTVSATIDTETRLLRIASPQDWHGRDTLKVLVSDSSNTKAEARIPVTVHPVNDPPKFITSLPALNSVTQDTTLNLGPHVTDVDHPAQTLIWMVSGAQTIGNQMENGGRLILSIPSDWKGAETLTIIVIDPLGASAEALLQIKIGGSPAPIIPEDPIEAADIDGDGVVGFSDFITFASSFGKSKDDADFNARIDLDGNGVVGFSDFLSFAQNFGKTVGS